METHGVSHVGQVRKRNEDRYLIRRLSDQATMLAVADGMGGETAGDFASKVGTDTWANFRLGAGDPRMEMERLMRQADWIIGRQSHLHPELEGMGTTITAALMQKASVYWTHVGDCRLYHLSSGVLTQITKDQTMAQFLVDEGEITSEQARHHPLQGLLEQCVGCGDLEVANGKFSVQPEDLLLLCSDGLYTELDEPELRAILTRQPDLGKMGAALVQAALHAGGHDNLTVVLARI